MFGTELQVLHTRHVHGHVHEHVHGHAHVHVHGHVHVDVLQPPGLARRDPACQRARSRVLCIRAPELYLRYASLSYSCTRYRNTDRGRATCTPRRKKRHFRSFHRSTAVKTMFSNLRRGSERNMHTLTGRHPTLATHCRRFSHPRARQSLSQLRRSIASTVYHDTH